MKNQIDNQATHAKVRDAYGTVQHFCRKKGFDARVYYAAVAGGNGNRGWPAPASEKVIATLREEGLLVEHEAA